MNPPSGFKDPSLEIVIQREEEEEEDDSLKDSGADLTSPKGEDDELLLEEKVRSERETRTPTKKYGDNSK